MDLNSTPQLNLPLNKRSQVLDLSHRNQKLLESYLNGIQIVFSVSFEIQGILPQK